MLVEAYLLNPEQFRNVSIRLYVFVKIFNLIEIDYIWLFLKFHLEHDSLD